MSLLIADIEKYAEDGPDATLRSIAAIMVAAENDWPIATATDSFEEYIVLLEEFLKAPATFQSITEKLKNMYVLGHSPT